MPGNRPGRRSPLRGRVRLLCCLLPLAVFCIDAPSAFAHGANFKDPSDDKKRSARPSPLAPAPPGVTTQPARGIPAVWKPEGWYRWWELNAADLTPQRRPGPTSAPAVTTPLPQAPLPQAPLPSAAFHRARLLRLLLKLADPEAKTEKRLLASALVTLGRLARDERPLFLLKRWARNRAAGSQIRDAALLGLGLLRRDEPAARFAPVHLRRVRQFLLERADDSEEPVRTRAYAILSLGLLADQGHEDTPLTRDGRAIVHALWLRLPHSQVSTEISSALLTAIGMQPPAGVPVGVFEGLKAISLGERVRSRSWDPYERSHAVSAVARLGKPGTDVFLLRLAGSTGAHAAIRCAAATGLMRRAPHMAAATRASAERVLARAADAVGTDWLVSSLQKMALGSLLGADLQAGCLWTPEKAGFDRKLRHDALEGRRAERPFCALAVALAARSLKEPTIFEGFESPVDPTEQAREELFFSRLMARRGLVEGGRSDRMRGAYAITLGLLRDREALDLLRENVRARDLDGVLRGHCALAIGLIGPSDLTNETTLLAATREQTHVFLHLQAARALGLLEVSGIFEKLQRRFDASETPSVTAGLALGLATLGDRRACAPLFGRLRESKATLGVRVSCLIALGVLLDPQPGSSAARMTVHANYTALTGAHRRYLDLL